MGGVHYNQVGFYNPFVAGRVAHPDKTVGGGRRMTARYEKLGFHFQYPENWILDESDALEGRESVAVYSPGGAFWSIIKHPAGEAPRRLLDAAVDAMRQEYTELDTEDVEETVAGRKVLRCDMNFYCLDLTNTAVARCFATPDATYLVFCQADDREFTQVEPVFKAITHSLNL